jgi:hypothetical protein
MVTKDSGPKVFDVARPGARQTDIGSKPMSVGHKSIASDPMVKHDVNASQLPTEEAPEVSITEQKSPTVERTDLKAPSVSKRIIAPLDKEEKTPVKPANNSGEKTPGIDEVTEATTVEEDTKKIKIDPAVERMEREDNLQKLIAGKKYFVTIHESTNSGKKTFLLTFVVAMIVGLIVLAALIDSEIIDLGIDLPFDLI